ncbi:hypothetical protein QYF36_022156 [Acer negundo]|nr:hypothetical protein QYF36_022156 [Acer negundo]
MPPFRSGRGCGPPPFGVATSRLLPAGGVHCRRLDLNGSIKACKNAALKCDGLKFQHYKLVVGTRLSADVSQHMQNCPEKIKLLEH